ncbi:N-acetylglucosamine-6-phosphate deacetylase [Flavitalea flava]
MDREKKETEERFIYKDVIRGVSGQLIIREGKNAELTIFSESEKYPEPATLPRSSELSGSYEDYYLGPGLIDLQLNGINGIDFNAAVLTEEDLVRATQFLLSKGITTYFPTIITNTPEKMLQNMSIIHRACSANPLVDACVGGIHMEGPFLSPEEGVRGAHNRQYMMAPDWDLFCRFQEAAGGRIKLITLAPEWEGSYAFIEKACGEGVLVAIGHSLAGTEQVAMAVQAGARLSTHLGNGVSLQLPRHPNILWDQLATDELYSCIIADGIHVPDSFLKVVMRTKGERTILVSDATCFAGMAPGEYQTPIGGTVIVDEQKKVSVKNSPGILAGAGKTLLEDIEYLVNHKLAAIGAIWQMASTHILNMMENNGLATNRKFLDKTRADHVLFRKEGNEIKVIRTIKNGKVVF